MNTSRTATPQLQENLYMLAMLAMVDTGAEGFAYFRYPEGASMLETFESFGITIAEERLSNDSSNEESPFVLSYPLRLRGTVEGAIAFAFSSRNQSEAAQPRLARHIAAIGKVWNIQSLAHAYQTTLHRIVELEEELIHSKISTVVRGALSGSHDTGSTDTVIRHVETVLRPSNTLRSLEEILETLSTEVQERSWIDQAKDILNAVSGMSEGEAHSHLRKISRKSRRPLADVARQIVQDAEIREGTTDRY